MIVKPLKVPLHLLKYEALLRRLPEHHPRYRDVQQDDAKYTAGHRGEDALTYHYDRLPDKDFYRLHDLRLPLSKHFFQLDTLILTPRFAAILEVKNFAGTLIFDHVFNQLIRRHNGREEAFEDPLLQVAEQKEMLTRWLRLQGFPQDYPIKPLVVISHANTVIKASDNHPTARNTIIHANFLPKKLHDYWTAHPRHILSDSHIHSLSQTLLQNHTPQNPDLLDRYNIKPSDLITGIQCASCTRFAMARKRGSWVCTSCSSTDRLAHLPAVRDFALLIGPSVRNRELRQFLQLTSPKVTSNLLNALHLPTQGKNKSYRYTLAHPSGIPLITP
ncbi:nuclease-related domain-containing protein [Thalassobacillus sp. CUG 92003]|uniref:nuclease-related domain-containing protein n=1 Tax=Thalassobacillus sp. CUG 92003 TaxID=2736641 RepID=UPI0015E65405|nr:nuclease-related domain-containing protein [Thalassobacillus sp. CUG 92003]